MSLATPLRPAVLAAALSDDFRIAAKSARAAGFAGIQLTPRLGSLDILSLSQSGKREMQSILRAQAIELVGLRMDLNSKGLGPGADVDAAIDSIEKVLAAAAQLQSPLLCVDLGTIPADTAAFAPAMAELGRRADRNGVVLAFRSDLSSFASIHAALKTADCPWFGVDFDPVAMLLDPLTAEEIFAKLGSLIRHVRGRDAILGMDQRTKPVVIGSGSVDWPGLLARLEGAEYRGWITIDPMELNNRAAGAREGLAKLTADPLV